jgi:hypothetical protein
MVVVALSRTRPSCAALRKVAAGYGTSCDGYPGNAHPVLDEFDRSPPAPTGKGSIKNLLEKGKSGCRVCYLTGALILAKQEHISPKNVRAQTDD